MQNLFAEFHCLWFSNEMFWHIFDLFYKLDSPATAIPWRAPSYEEEASRKCMSLSTDGGNNGLFANTCDAAEAFVCEISIYEN